MREPPSSEHSFDVIIIGGALSGGAAAMLLREECPGLKILIVEKSEKFTRRVGEATVEVSTYFLSRVLGLTQHLNQKHLVKQGLRFWFFNERTRDLNEASEIGGRYLARVPAYQVDRSVLDQEVLDRAVSRGAELWRPATVADVTLHSGGEQEVRVRLKSGEERICRSRWVIDASGVGAILARKEGWLRHQPAHPTASAWGRWRKVVDWDGADLAAKYPEWAMQCYGIRGTATNHFMGDGWWAWCIPLKGDEVSVGVVFDQRLVKFPEAGSVGERLKGFLNDHPVAREILKDAQWVEGDVHWRRNLCYSCDRIAGDGFALVGDAAGFLDPFYSPGMDWVAFSVVGAVQLIAEQQRGMWNAEKVEAHHHRLTRAYWRWFEAVYKDKYQYMGDYELMRLAFLLDLGLYYLGVASQPYRLGKRAFQTPIFSNVPSVPFYHLMKTYNRRFARMAESRRRRGVLGRRNSGKRFMFGGYTFSGKSSWPILRALASWMALEFKEGWRSWFASPACHGESPARAAEPAPASSMEKMS